MKKIILCAVILCTLTACGTKETAAPSFTETEKTTTTAANEMQGYTGTEGASLKNVSNSNYADVAKSLFGIDVSTKSGWELKEAKSPNGVNNLIVSFKAPTDTDGKEIIKAYFDDCIKASGGSIYTQEINWDTMAVSKGETYTDFDAFFKAEGTSIGSLNTAMWLYEYSGKSVQYSVSCDSGAVEVSLTLLG